MRDLDAVFNKVTSADGDAVLHIPASLLSELQRRLELQNYFVTVVDRAPVFDKTTLLHALYQSCEMPAYFGFNWDALQDSLNDFSWKSASGYVLVFKNFELLQTRAPEDAKVFLEIVRDVSAGRLEDHAPPLKLLILQQ